jgi:transcriptional regulator with XRE-family HTH domain
MTNHSPSFLRAYRRKWKLSQAGLARLLGAKSEKEIASYEHGKRTPRLKVLMRYRMLFGAELEALFPESYAQENEAFLRDAQERFEEIKADTTKAGRAERELLVIALRRAITRIKNNEDE